MQLRGGPVPVAGPSVPLTAPSVPLTGPLFPLRGPFFNCPIVGHSPGFNCVGPRGASIRAARVQNETAPEKFLNRYEKRFEKREKGSEKRSETRLKNF